MNRAERRRRNRLVARKYAQDWRNNGWYPPSIRGALEGVKEIRKEYERKARAQARDALKVGEEPEPYRQKSRAKWDLF